MNNQLCMKIRFVALFSLLVVGLSHAKSLDEILELSFEELTRLQVIPKTRIPKREEVEPVYHNENSHDSTRPLPPCMLVEQCSSGSQEQNHRRFQFKKNQTSDFSLGVREVYRKKINQVNTIPSLTITNVCVYVLIACGKVFDYTLFQSLAWSDQKN